MCEQANCVVVSVDYRIGPKTPFPACIDDGWESLLYCYENADAIGINIKKLAIGGSSPGGNISSILCHKIGSISSYFSTSCSPTLDRPCLR
ncbi:carboxylesterase [Schizosaccharomyces octosporus yFS286]|uniref:Carboxylesterase n=1 Tax=Schizosaccharomyces octosporus (strain yFS286) TaxID=483514 RepID=S9PUP2_SCHOY|nr:carboxylesterase [Schizosaccharomyces octosporus yFS286]EPX71702.1 carboxylesterase [Schizosaccharomyces octosporus yFS286]